jgi:hypothetical protein
MYTGEVDGMGAASTAVWPALYQKAAGGYLQQARQSSGMTRTRYAAEVMRIAGEACIVVRCAANRQLALTEAAWCSRTAVTAAGLLPPAAQLRAIQAQAYAGSREGGDGDVFNSLYVGACLWFQLATDLTLSGQL